LKSGFTHYIAKPYTKEALLSLIEQMINKIW
jgi:YesN/AraC family two-component response regulator